MFDPERKRPDAIAVVDVDPASPRYASIVGQVAMPHTGDELHHFGWNACSSCLCPNAPHPPWSAATWWYRGCARRASISSIPNPIRSSRSSPR
ncbi:selenium-binding protein SBP56-related protein [Cupriavidus basilensis]